MLIQSIKRKNAKMFLYLLLSGYDPLAKDDKGYNCFEYICHNRIYEKFPEFMQIMDEMGFLQRYDGRAKCEDLNGRSMLNKDGLALMKARSRAPMSLEKCVRNSLLKTPAIRLQIIRYLKFQKFPRLFIEFLQYDDLKNVAGTFNRKHWSRIISGAYDMDEVIPDRSLMDYYFDFRNSFYVD